MRTSTVIICAFLTFLIALCAGQTNTPVGGYGLHALEFDPETQAGPVRVKLVTTDYDTWFGFTIMGWIWLDPRGNNTERPIAFKGHFSPNFDGTENNGVGFMAEFYAGITKENNIEFRMGCDLDYGFKINATPSLPLGEWVHFAVAVDWDSQSAQIYLNGAPILGATQNWSENCSRLGLPGPYRATFTTGPDAELVPRVRSHTIQLGLYTILFDTSGPRRFFGRMDDFRVFNKTLTTSDIGYHIQNALVGDEEGLISYHPFNEGSGNTTSPWPLDPDFRNAPADVETVHGYLSTSAMWSTSDIHLDYPRFTYFIPNQALPLQLYGVEPDELSKSEIIYRITRTPTNGVLRGIPVGATSERTLAVGDVVSPQNSVGSYDSDYPVIYYVPDLNFVGEDSFGYRPLLGTNEYPRETNVPLQSNCPSIDQCGVCLGNDECVGCDGVIYPSGVVPPRDDACGVCGGNNFTCTGCDGVVVPPPGIPRSLDVCGVCGGDNSTCVGCDGVVIPPPGIPRRLDVCGVCGGDGSSCTGCDGVVVLPPGTPKRRDSCGVCGGNNTACSGCDGVLGSSVRRDECGVCGGNGSTCADCNGVPNGPDPANACGWCPGDTSDPDWCLDCSGCPHGPKVVDVCGVCGGDNSTCPPPGCVLDICGVCNGNGDTCRDPVCGYTTIVQDACGVCGGDNSTCQCVFYKHYHIARMDCVLIDFTSEHTLKIIDDLVGVLENTRARFECADLPLDEDVALEIGEQIRDLNTFISSCANGFCEYLGEINPVVKEYVSHSSQ